jgi:hypothetical protein
MREFWKWPAIALGLALLSACILTPGKFTSTLDIKRDRSFTFTYVGEVIAEPPSTGLESSTSDDADKTDGAGNTKVAPPAKPKAPKPEDEAKMKALAETLSKEYGYRSVRYVGNYKFLIDYAVSGKLTHNFIYPFNLDGEVIIPFIAIELRGKDRIRLKAPGYAPGDNKKGGMGDMAGMSGSGKNSASALDGTFTVTTDAEVISQNQESGVETLPDGRKRIVWRATPLTPDAPTAVLKLDALP